MRGPHPQGHVTLRYCGYLSYQKRYISTFTRPVETKLSRVITQDKGTPSTKSRDTSFMWSRDKSKSFCLHIHKVHSPQNLVGCWLRMRRPHPKSHMILQLCYHVKNKKRHISSTQDRRDVEGKLALLKNKQKISTRTNNVEMK